MTLEPTASIPTSDKPKPFVANKPITILEELFSLGYATSEEIKVYEDNNGVEVNVQYRTLIPAELRDIAEGLSTYRSLVAQVWTEKIETLARSIVYINKMPLILDPKDRKEYEEKHKEPPGTLEQARIILYEKIKSPHIIDLLFEKYQSFSETIAKSFDDIKKKLNSQPS